MTDSSPTILAKFAAAGIFALIATFSSRWAFVRICEFKPSWLNAFIAFAIGSSALIAWNELVTFVRDQFMNGQMG